MHSLPGHQLRPVAAGIGDVVHNHQMMLGVDGHLNIEADDAGSLAARRIERASGSVRETCLSGAASKHVLQGLVCFYIK